MTTVERPRTWSAGVLPGVLGMLCFSGTVPATRVASPVFGSLTLTLSRILIAAVLGAVILMCVRARPPRRELWPGIVSTGLGMAVGYPLLLALAVEHVPASHAAVVVGLVPAATAVTAVVRNGERLRPWFWVGCVTGFAAVLGYLVSQGGGRVQPADLLLLAAVLSCGIAYVEGGRVSGELGGTATLCWAMIALAPAAAVVFAVTAPGPQWHGASGSAWLGLLYAGVCSMLLGSILWYRGLRAGGVARIGQLNLAQPLLAIVWSALLLGEHISWPVAVTGAVVGGATALCLRSRTAAS